MLKILNRILWFVQAVGISLPPMDIPGFRKGSSAVKRSGRALTFGAAGSAARPPRHYGPTTRTAQGGNAFGPQHSDTGQTAHAR
jgi:hypothetical protein